VAFRHTLKTVLKRGALVAAVNWPVAVVQAVADGLVKLLIAVPLIGGVVLVTLVVGAGTDPFVFDDWRVLAATVVTSLLSHPLVLIAFVLALGVVIVGGAVFMFLVKGGTVSVLVQGNRAAGAVEVPPLRPEILATAAAFTVEGFIASARALFPRYARLGVLLMVVYLGSGAVYVAGVVASRDAAEGWGVATLLTIAFVVWTIIVNLLYLLVQIVIAAENCRVSVAARRVLRFLRAEARLVGGVFLVILAMVVLATGASVLAFAALGLISLVPFVWLAALPLQLIAFVLRAIVFQYIGLSSIGAYFELYRRFEARIGQDRNAPLPVEGLAPSASSRARPGPSPVA
jgi:hypothetical protein